MFFCQLRSPVIRFSEFHLSNFNLLVIITDMIHLRSFTRLCFEMHFRSVRRLRI